MTKPQPRRQKYSVAEARALAAALLFRAGWCVETIALALGWKPKTVERAIREAL